MPHQRSGQASWIGSCQTTTEARALAASYRSSPQWLIGPELYPAFLRTLKIVAFVIIGLVALGVVLDVIDEGGRGFLEAMIGLTFGGLMSDLVSAMGWVVLVAGKGHETYQDIAGTRNIFSDAKQVRLALQARENKRSS